MTLRLPHQDCRRNNLEVRGLRFDRLKFFEECWTLRATVRVEQEYPMREPAIAGIEDNAPERGGSDPPHEAYRGSV